MAQDDPPPFDRAPNAHAAAASPPRNGRAEAGERLGKGALEVISDRLREARGKRAVGIPP